mgnify:CR=1 FL=1
MNMSKTKDAKKNLKEFKEYAKKNPVAAKKRARDILIKTGVLTKTGKKKDVIVSWQ